MFTLMDIPEKHHEVALEWFKGKKIQVSQSHHHDQWLDIEAPTFFENRNYRVKPEIVEVWVNIRYDGGRHYHESHESALALVNSPMYRNMEWSHIALRLSSE